MTIRPFAISCTAILALALTDTADARDLTQKEKAVIAKQVSWRLKDPESAIFTWLPMAPEDPQRAPIYCAYVRGKNAMGGYSDDIMFVGALYKGSPPMFQFLAMSQGDEVAVLIKYMCRGEGYAP